MSRADPLTPRSKPVHAPSDSQTDWRTIGVGIEPCLGSALPSRRCDVHLSRERVAELLGVALVVARGVSASTTTLGARRLRKVRALLGKVYRLLRLRA